MKGNNSKGARLDNQQLNQRLSTIVHTLHRAELPTEIPSADQVAAAATDAAAANATTTATNASRSMPAKQSAASPIFAASPAPKAAVLSINLRDVHGWQAGGSCHVMSLGAPVLGDARWEMPSPGCEDGSVLRLRVGLRGRRTMSARCHASIAGRTFEWWLEVMGCRHDISVHGGPLWVARELNSSMATLGQRIIGRVPLKTGGHTGPSSPELLWKAIPRHCGSDAPRLPGAVNTGLIHPSVQVLLQVLTPMVMGCRHLRALALGAAASLA